MGVALVATSRGGTAEAPMLGTSAFHKSSGPKLERELDCGCRGGGYSSDPKLRSELRSQLTSRHGS